MIKVERVIIIYPKTVSVIHAGNSGSKSQKGFSLIKLRLRVWALMLPVKIC